MIYDFMIYDFRFMILDWLAHATIVNRKSTIVNPAGVSNNRKSTIVNRKSTIVNQQS
jgi:hypothetical protein